MNVQLLDGKLVASKIKNNLCCVINKHEKKPVLVACLIGDNPASQVYVANKKKACEEVGIRSMVREFPTSTTLATIMEWIRWCNESPDVSGILVQLPLPDKFDTNFILRQINPLKDIDCFHPENLGLLMTGQPRFLPCTPAGIIELLKHYNIRPKGKHVVVVNNTIVVGQPLTSLLTQDVEWGNATVTMCHRYTRNIEKVCRRADIIITAVGRQEFRLTADMVRKEQIIIDVGINRIYTEDGKSKIIGDVDFGSVSEIVKAITPVPGGVGPLTVAMLLKNTVDAFERSLYGQEV